MGGWDCVDGHGARGVRLEPVRCGTATMASGDAGEGSDRMKWLRRVGVVVAVFVAIIVVWVGVAAMVYSPEYVMRVLSSRESQASDYLDGFPLRTLEAAPDSYTFTERLDEDRVRSIFGDAFGVSDFDSFLEEGDASSFIVIKDDAIIYEQYFNGNDRNSMVTSFSVAKSFASSLIGIAIDEGYIDSVGDPITDYLPELSGRDSRFRGIAIRDLLLMASGLDYQEMRWFLFNGDDPLTTYYLDQRDISLTNTNIIGPPTEYFQYNKYHPQLLGMILERATGMSVTEYTQTRLWDRIGMSYDGAWALDSVGSGFEKMEAGLNARAIDFAKLGRLFLNEGNWEGVQVVSQGWVNESTSVDPDLHNPDYYRTDYGQVVYDDGGGYYQYMWYGKLRDGSPADFAAEGDRGQIIYVSPENNVIIVRNGTNYGVESSAWIDAFYAVASEI